MKVGIDSYCYHRYFGEIYPDQTDPGLRWTFRDFVRRAVELAVDDVSLESCFFESLDPGYLSELGAVLDEKGLSRVLAWGHPDGLEAGPVAASGQLGHHLGHCPPPAARSS